MLIWNWGKPLLEGYTNEPQKGYAEIQPDAGVPFRRLKFTDIYDLASCTFSLTRSDYIRFMSWYKFDLRQGTLPFKIFDCRYGVERTARLVGEVPQYSTNSNRYNLSVTLAFMPEVISKEFYLVVGDDNPLIVNDYDYLIVDEPLRI